MVPGHFVLPGHRLLMGHWTGLQVPNSHHPLSGPPRGLPRGSGPLRPLLRPLSCCRPCLPPSLHPSTRSCPGAGPSGDLRPPGSPSRGLGETAEAPGPLTGLAPSSLGLVPAWTPGRLGHPGTRSHALPGEEEHGGGGRPRFPTTLLPGPSERPHHRPLQALLQPPGAPGRPRPRPAADPALAGQGPRGSAPQKSGGGGRWAAAGLGILDAPLGLQHRPGPRPPGRPQLSWTPPAGCPPLAHPQVWGLPAWPPPLPAPPGSWAARLPAAVGAQALSRHAYERGPGVGRGWAGTAEPDRATAAGRRPRGAAGRRGVGRWHGRTRGP